MLPKIFCHYIEEGLLNQTFYFDSDAFSLSIWIFKKVKIQLKNSINLKIKRIVISVSLESVENSVQCHYHCAIKKIYCQHKKFPINISFCSLAALTFPHTFSLPSALFLENKKLAWESAKRATGNINPHERKKKFSIFFYEILMLFAHTTYSSHCYTHSQSQRTHKSKNKWNKIREK